MTLAILIAASALFANALQQPKTARDVEVQPTTGTASISGVVVTTGDRPQPVRRAVVTLAGAELRPSRGAITDDDGRFSIGNLPAGRFTLTVSRASFITSVYGAKRPGRPGTPVVVGDGARVDDLVVRIWRGAALAGVLRDDNGRPVPGITVTAIAARAPGQPMLTLTNNGAATTNDLGEFRIFGLEPGTYVVVARPSSGGASSVHEMSEADVDAVLDQLRRRKAGAGAQPSTPPGAPLPAPRAATFDYAPIYYPGTALIAQAAPITLAAGQEHTGLDFGLERVATSFVEGLAVRPDGRPAAGTTLQMTAIVPSGPFASGSPLQLNASTGPDGRFRINQVTPGSYRLLARAPVQPEAAQPSGGGIVRPGPSGASLWAVQDLTIGGTDVSGIVLSLQRGTTISGRVAFEGQSLAPPGDLTQIRIAAQPPEVLGQKPGTVITTIAFAPPASVRADGTFEIAHMAPGPYRLLIGGPALNKSGWWARSAIAGDRDLLDGTIEVGREDISGVQVTFTDRRTELSGTLQSSSGAPVTDVFVIAFAADRRHWGANVRRVQAMRPGSDGRFTIKDLPPGEYLLGAVTDVDGDEWQDPGFLERLVPASIKLSIADGEKKVQDLRIG